MLSIAVASWIVSCLLAGVVSQNANETAGKIANSGSWQLPGCCKQPSLLNATEQERCVLLAFFKAMDGYNWRIKDGWNTSTDHCDNWHGVTCNANLVEQLELDDNGLAGVWRSNLALPNLKILRLDRNQMQGKVKHFLPRNATSLARLTLSFNDLSGSLPWHLLTQYKHLKKLQLALNRNIAGIINESVASLEKLEILSLGQTRVSGRIPAGITRLKNLWFLDLEDLNVSGNISFIAELPHVRYLHLKSNRLQGELPRDIGDRLDDMLELNLQYNQLTGSIPKSIGRMADLTMLDLSSNNFTGHIPASILQLKYLTTLDLSYNNFQSISSNLSLPSICSLNLAHNTFNITARQLVTSLKKMENRATLKVLDISHCGLAGPMPIDVWDFNRLLFLNVSGNHFGGRVPGPRDTLPFLIYADLSHNNFTGALPQALSLLIAIKELDLRHNFKNLRITKPVPPFATAYYNSNIKESPGEPFTCPLLRFQTVNRGILRIDSSYYGGVGCSCNPGYYGYDGQCHRCFDKGQCKSHPNQNESKMAIPPNYFPIPTADNATSFIRCSSYYHDSLQCNPFGNSSCRLIIDSNNTKTECQNVCTYNTTGFLCSHCQDGYYKDNDRCLPCPRNGITRTLVVIVLACLLIPIPGWILQRTRPHLSKNLLFKIVFRLGGVVVPSVVIVACALTEIIPTYAAEFFILSVFLAALDRLESVRAFAFTLFVYFQVLDSLDVCSYSTECQYCSFAGLLDYFDIDVVARVVNFQFSGITCLIPPLSRPIGRLIFLSVAPLVLSFFVIAAHLLDYYVVTVVFGRHAERSTMLENCKRTVVLFLNVFYYPVAVAAIKVFPCQLEPGDIHRHMSAYPWIKCDSGTNYRNLVILGSFVMVFYVCGLPFVLALLFRKYDHHRQGNSDRQTAGPQDQESTDGTGGDWLRAICSPFKKTYQHSALAWSVALMLRRLFVAGLLAIFHDRQSDALAMPLTVVLLSSILLVAVKKPYRNTTNWELENWADVAAFCVILVTYTAMASRHDVTYVAAVSVFGLNILFICAIVVVSFFQFVHDRRRSRRTQDSSHQQRARSYGSIHLEESR